MARIGLFIDAANLFYAQRDQGWYVDFFAAYDWVHTGHEPGCAYYFTGIPPVDKPEDREKHRRYRRALALKGFTVVEKEPKRQFDKDRDTYRTKANLDVEITLKLLAEIGQYDEVVFFGGDGDFAPVLDHLRNLGKRVRVIAAERSAAEDIVNAAHEFKSLQSVRKHLERQDSSPP